MTPLIPITAVEGLMKKAFLEKAVSPGLFWDAIAKANLYIPLSKTDEFDAGKIKDDEEVLVDYPIILGLDANNKYVVWIFTSPAVMFDYIERKVPVLELPAPQAFNKVKDSEHEVVLIGPEGLTLSLHPELLKTLSEGKSPETNDQKVMHVPKESEVFVGEPEAATARSLEGRFRDLFKTLPEVLEAAFIQVADDNGSRLLLGLKLIHEDRDTLRAITERVAKAAEGVLDKGKLMDITFINGSLKEAFAKWGKPFYVR